jgi:hypothetical protein
MMESLWTYVSLLGLGAYHGINPGMGWLFAVALGMQERSRRAVLATVPPFALGHALSIGVVVTILWLLQMSIPEAVLRIGTAAVLFSFGLYRLIRMRHPRWVGMRVGFRDLAIWSFLMASAHGAGLMLVPFLLRTDHRGEHVGHVITASLGHDAGTHVGHVAAQLDASAHTAVDVLGRLLAVSMHTAGYLLVTAAIAVVVYEKLGLALLRRAWLNLDVIWLVALMASGILILIG